MKRHAGIGNLEDAGETEGSWLNIINEVRGAGQVEGWGGDAQVPSDSDDSI